MIDTLLTEVDDIVDREYHRANKDHLAFASDHEGHDVLQEEIEEAREELEKLEKASYAMKVAIRQNDEKAVRNIAKSALLRRLQFSCGSDASRSHGAEDSIQPGIAAE